MPGVNLGQHLPQDWRDALLVGRWDAGAGPVPVIVETVVSATCRAARQRSRAAERVVRRSTAGKDLGALDELPITAASRRSALRLLAPCDLQCIKACGVTFAVSAVERVIEERARGDAKAQSIRDALGEKVGADIRSVRPGSATAARLKEALIADGLWSQYLEVAIGPDAKVFTKSPVLSAVGWGDWIGVRSESQWNNPEPEIVLACDARGRILGAALGNDVNLRDIEGRSALLLGKAKDNNASCAIGPFIRLFDDRFRLDDVRSTVVALQVQGADDYRLEGSSSMSLISRDPADLVRQTLDQHHYPDGFMLFLGTMFAPTQDRETAGRGFTHKSGDIVRVSAPALGTLVNKVTTSQQAPPWTLGIAGLIRSLAQRLLPHSQGDR